MKVIIKDNKYIPFLNTVGPILTPVEIPEEIYRRLRNGGIKIEEFKTRLPEVKPVHVPKKIEGIRFEDIASKPLKEEVPFVEEVVEEEEVEVEEVVEVVEVVEEVVEEKPQNKKKSKKR